MEDRAEDDSDVVSTKKPKRKSKHRDRTSSSDVEEEDGDSAARVSFTEEDDAEKKDTKKEKKKMKKKRKMKRRNRHGGEGDRTHSTVGGGAAEDEVEERTSCEEEEGEKDKKTKMKKKTKGKKKDNKKRKRDDDDDDDDGDDGEGKDDGSTFHPDDDDHSSGGDKKRCSMEEEGRGKKRSKKDERRIRRPEEMDERIVASSAMEYHPIDYKRQYSKSKGASTSGDATVRDDVCLDGKRGGASSLPSGHGGGAEGDRAEEGAAAEGAEATTTTSSTAIANGGGGVTLLLFYQYVEPPWDETQFRNAYEYATGEAARRGMTGRMRIAREGMNCTLTGSPGDVRGWCGAMRSFDGGRSRMIDAASGARRTEFADTEFKLTDDLPPGQRFPKLHAFEVVELVHYGLAGSRAPDLSAYGGTHLEPEEYHVKMCEPDTVIIDVRNHYEANIGRFDPPVGGATMIDPMMRKSTEFPLWLDKKETKEMLRGKQVLMYCTGGVRCERASALLKQKIDEDEDTKDLGIKGVYQLQGGIDKYFRHFPAGGLWKGKNYTFDKRFAHAPPAVEAVKRTKRALGDEGPPDASSIAADEKKSDDGTPPANATDEILGKCEACSKPWDMYRGKRRCPTCGVPSLICRECFEADKAGTKRLGKQVRCDLCVADGVRSKFEFRDREEREMKIYEGKLQRKLDDEYDANTRKPKPNPERITRLFLKNMCAKQMDESKLLEVLAPARVTYIQWLTDRNTGKFYGSAFIEVKTAEDASSALALDGMVVLGRKITVKYQKADEKDIWPIPGTEIKLMSY